MTNILILFLILIMILQNCDCGSYNVKSISQQQFKQSSMSVRKRKHDLGGRNNIYKNARADRVSKTRDNGRRRGEQIIGKRSITSQYPRPKLAFLCRGGAQSDEDSDEVESDYDSCSDFGSDDLMSDFDESLSSDSFHSRMLQHYHQTPPLTKAFLTSSFALTLYGYATGQGFPTFATLDYGRVFQGQIWRLATGFLNYGPFGVR